MFLFVRFGRWGGRGGGILDTYVTVSGSQHFQDILINSSLQFILNHHGCVKVGFWVGFSHKQILGQAEKHPSANDIFLIIFQSCPFPPHILCFFLFFAKNFNFCPICPQMVSGWSLIGVGCWCFSVAHRLFSPISGTPHCAADGIFVGSPLQQQFWIFSMYRKFPLLRTGEPPKFHKGFVAYYYTITITVIQPFTRADFVLNQLKYTILFLSRYWSGAHKSNLIFKVLMKSLVQSTVIIFSNTNFVLLVFSDSVCL